MIAEYDNGALPTAPTREYIYAGGQLVATLSNTGAPAYHHPDHLSARVTTDAQGAKLGEQGHYPFGESWYSINTTTKWQFTSYERDSESGLDYAMFRYDSSRLGRFMTPDPLAGSISNPQSLNRYAYVRNDPINFTDPLGLTLCWGYYTYLCDNSGCWFTGFICLQPLADAPAGPQNDKPTHCQPGVIKAMEKSWDLAARGMIDREAGFTAYQYRGKVLTTEPKLGAEKGRALLPDMELKLTINQEVVQVSNLAFVHTHSNRSAPWPSPGDMQRAQNKSVPFYTIASSGIYVTDPTQKSGYRKVAKDLNDLKQQCGIK